MIYTSADQNPPIPTLIVLIILIIKLPPSINTWTAQSPPLGHSLHHITRSTGHHGPTSDGAQVHGSNPTSRRIDEKAFNPNLGFPQFQFPLPTRPVRLTAAPVPLEEGPELAEFAGTCSTECIPSAVGDCQRRPGALASIAW